MERTVYETEHLTVGVDDALHIVRVVRSATPFATPDLAARSFRQAGQAMAGIDRARHAVLVDLRLAPGRNDPEFETAMAGPRRETLAGFARRAVLVRTTAGRLQEQRLSREQSTEHPMVFSDEAEALRWAIAR